MAKKQGKSPFEDYWASCDPEDQALLSCFFQGFYEHCIMSKSTVKMLKEDFENAILYYVNHSIPLDSALNLLDTRFLGGFYARPPVAWFPLDNAAKIYPLSMARGKMTMFRLSATLKAPVVPALLQMALNFTIKRFPSFATTLKKGFFWHYLDTAKRRFCVEAESDIPCRPIQVSQSGSQTFRTLYFDQRISVEFFHVLTDGFGGMEFLKALVTEYVRLTGVPVTPGDLVCDIQADPRPEEIENAFALVERTGSGAGFVDKPALQLSGRLSDIRPCRLLHFHMPTQQLLDVARSHETTVTAYLLALMFLATKTACDELSGEISFQVPVNMRKFHPSKTLRNFSMYCGIRLPISQITDIHRILPEITAQLQQKGSREKMDEMLTATQNMVSLLRLVPLFIKQPVAKIVYGFLDDRIFTSTLSNLGVVQLPAEVSEQVQSMDFVLGASAVNRIGCSVVTVNGNTTFSITKMTADPSFEERLYELLRCDGITVEAKGSVLYGT